MKAWFANSLSIFHEKTRRYMGKTAKNATHIDEFREECIMNLIMDAMTPQSENHRKFILKQISVYFTLKVLKVK